MLTGHYLPPKLLLVLISANTSNKQRECAHITLVQGGVTGLLTIEQGGGGVKAMLTLAGAGVETKYQVLYELTG